MPVAFFEVIGKEQRQSGQSVTSSDRTTDHDSGLSQGTNASTHTRSESSATAKPSGHQRGVSMSGRNVGAMVYGVVQYDFNAERTDELDAKAGEAIIVVAQSNPEWFVAKPIGRLGGPGLIPVAYVDIKDSATMQSVTDPLEAVRKAGVPRVEEWKQHAKNYKEGSISLGKFDNAQGQMAQDMGRMSLQQGTAQQRNQYVRPPNRFPSMKTNQSQPQQMPQHPNQQQQQMPPAPVQASVPRYCFENDMYWYIIECKMEDGSCWALARYYADFYDFQIALLESFPEEAGNKGKPRTLPFMPGPVAHVTDAISNGRRENLDEYIKKILAMPPHISKSILVRNLFKQKPEQDWELEPNEYNRNEYRQSSGSQHSLQRIPSSQASRQTSNNHTPASGYGGMPPPNGRNSHQRQQQSMSASQGIGMANGGPYLHTQASNLTQNSTTSVRATNPGGAMKIKVYFQSETIVIRVPQDISLAALKEKLIERLKVNEDIAIQYKDDPSNTYADMTTDNDLDTALQRNSGKLALHVNYASG